MLLYPFYKWESVRWEELSGCSKVTSWQVTEPWLKPKPPDSQSFAPSAAGEDMVLSPLMISHVLLWTQTYSKSLITKSYTPRVGQAQSRVEFPCPLFWHATSIHAAQIQNGFIGTMPTLFKFFFFFLPFMESVYVYGRKQDKQKEK